MKDFGITQNDIANTIGRKSQSYVSDRLSNKKSWQVSDLDEIAPLFGYPDALSLIASSVGTARSSINSTSDGEEHT